ncbi:hypothetical protein [Sphingomonas immobilis]|uniref:Uncharacterized protein n=1 Tax=Sphingomonas immobilis TaxID=3063997 RepID=A0ABT9A0D0_9SPHN|nr:hypothetical protein [Sphingomonas sp. CA1-15]MDO7842451.1 hypothetical protein [Sphingomonas sp. CA1-15]
MRLASAIFFALFCAAPAIAQRHAKAETGSLVPIPAPVRVSENPKLSDDVRARIATAEFARCSVARFPDRVERALSLPKGGLAYWKALERTASNECMDSGIIAMRRPLLRGALFVELYRRRWDAQQRGQTWGPSLTKVSFNIDPLTHPSEDAMRDNELLSLGNCVIAKDEASARNAILLPTASKGQEAALMSLVPSLGGCIPAGMKLTFSRPVIEAAIAEVLYRGAETPTVQTAGIK